MVLADGSLVTLITRPFSGIMLGVAALFIVVRVSLGLWRRFGGKPLEVGVPTS